MEKDKERYVGTLVGEITSKEFRLAVAHETIREQDIIAVDATLNKTDESGQLEKIRVWAKVQRIERINPLFPVEAGHELAETRTDPMETVLSLSREVVSAVCQVLGSEPLDSGRTGKLDSLRYPPKPATSAYRPDSRELGRVLVGGLNQDSAMDIAELSNRSIVDVKVDGHAIVTRHLAILAMTGAGKSWAARRIIEQLADKSYPMVIFDPHGDYTGLADIDSLRNRVNRYHATLPIFEEDADTVAQFVNNLGYALSDTMMTLFSDLFSATRDFYEPEGKERENRIRWLSNRLNEDRIRQYGIRPDLWLIANIADAVAQSIRDARDGNQDDLQYIQNTFWKNLQSDGTVMRTLNGILRRTRRAASQLNRMEKVNKAIARNSLPMPQNREELVQYGKISIVSLAGYTGEFQSTIYSIIAEELFEAKVTKKLRLPFLVLLEEAHNFVPGRGTSSAEQQSITITKQIAQEGRKFGVGLVMISQRPSRLDETALSQCNSYIIMRMVNPADQNFVRRVIESLGEEETRLLSDLDVGEALFSGQMVNFPVLVRMKPPESQGEREEKNAFEHLEEVRPKSS